MSDAKDDLGHATLMDHLGELRVRIVNSLIGMVITTVAAFNYSEPIFDFIRKPIEPYLPTGGLIYTGPMDKFMAHIKLAVVVGVITACPFWLYQVWKFVAPGLYKKEKSLAVVFIVSGTVLFLGGASFAYFVVLPMAFKFLMTFGGSVDKPMIAIESYLSFVSQITLMFGLCFEMPLIISTLSLLGFISRAFLIKSRRYAVLIIAIVSAIVTPPDLLSMTMMMFPMLALYELSIVVVWFIERRKAKEALASETALTETPSGRINKE